MTHDKTDNLIQRIIDSPDKLSDSEVADIINNDYLRSIYHTASLLKSATSKTRSYNLDEEWHYMKIQLYDNAKTKSPTNKRRWLYAAAIFIGILICGTIGLLLFSNPAIDCDSDVMTALSDIDSIPFQADTVTKQSEIIPEGNVKDTIAETGNIIMHASKNVQDDNYAQAKPEVESIKSAESMLPTLEQALMLTDDDMVIAQMYLAFDYDTTIPCGQEYMTTVNYGYDMRSDRDSNSWLSEFMKYVVGLTVGNLSIQRGSANILYRLTLDVSDISASDRDAAYSAINALIDSDVCGNDPISEALVIGCRDKLK